MKIKEIAKGTFKLMLGGWLGYEMFNWTKATIKVLGKRTFKWSLKKLAEVVGSDELKEKIDNFEEWSVVGENEEEES